MKYDYLVVGSGLYGAIFAHEAKAHAKKNFNREKREYEHNITYHGSRNRQPIWNRNKTVGTG